MIVLMELAKKVQQKRGSLTYAQLAAKIGCSPGNIRKIEAEGTQPGFALAVRVAEGIG